MLIKSNEFLECKKSIFCFFLAWVTERKEKAELSKKKRKKKSNQSIFRVNKNITKNIGHCK